MAAINYYSPINLNALELQNFRVHNAAQSDLTSPGAGRLIFDSTVLKFYNGSAWKTVLTDHQSITLAGGTNNGTLKLTVGGVATDNIAVTGLGAMAYKASLAATDIPSLDASKITSGTFADARIASAATWNAKQNAIADVTDTVSGYVSKVTQTSGKIAVTHASFATPTVTWTGGTSAGPTLKITTDGGASTAVAIPSASASASGIITNAAQTIGGVKTFNNDIKLAASAKFYVNGGAADGSITPYFEYDAEHHAFHFTCGIYSDSFVSAGGFSSGGGGGGGTDFTIQALTLGALTAYYLDAPDAPQNNYLGNQAYPVGYAIRAQQDANGHTLAYLDSSGKLPLSMLPDSMLGQLIYAGTVNASGVATLTNAAKEKFGISANTVQLTNDTGTYGYGKFEGAFFLMSADSSFASLPLQVGDWLISIGSAWKKIDNTDAVTSVVGQTGAVTAAQISSALSLGAAATKGVDTSWPTTPTNNNLPTTAAVDAKIKAYAATLPHSYTISGSSVTTYTTAYDFTSQNLVATLYDSSNNVVMTDMQIVSSSGKYGMKVIFANAIGSSTYRLVVFGV